MPTRRSQTGHATQTGRTTQNPPSRSAVSLDATFTHHANAICASGNAYGASHPFPVAHFDPSNPSPAQLPKVGRYLEAGPDVVGRLIDLTPPSRGATDWRAVVAVLRREHSNQRAQIQAARTSDPQNFSRTAQDAAVIERELLAVARAHGLGPARSCLVYFGG